LSRAAGSFVKRAPVAVISARPSASGRRLERKLQDPVSPQHRQPSRGPVGISERVLASVIVRIAEEAAAQIDRAITAGPWTAASRKEHWRRVRLRPIHTP
jgi:hypothetical protein